MSSYKICNYCGEYEHDCRCAAAKEIKKLITERDSLEKQVMRLREALHYYADAENYHEVLEDFGGIAKAAPSSTSAPSNFVRIEVAEKLFLCLDTLRTFHRHSPTWKTMKCDNALTAYLQETKQ